MVEYLFLLCFSFGVVCIEGFKHKLKTIRPYDTSIFPSLIIPRRWEEPYPHSEQDRYTMQNHYSERDEYSMNNDHGRQDGYQPFLHSEQDEYTMPNQDSSDVSFQGRAQSRTMQSRNRPISGPNSVAPKVVLYNRPDHYGQSILIEATKVRDLTTKNFKDMTKSVCVSGVWIFYTKNNYNEGISNAKIEFRSGPSHKSCSNLAEIGGSVASLRYVGSSTNFTTDSVTLYSQTSFQGKEFFYTESAKVFHPSVPINSFIITGYSSWTFYADTDYEGTSVCFKRSPPNNYEPKYVRYISDFSVYSIKSVRKGCFQPP